MARGSNAANAPYYLVSEVITVLLLSPQTDSSTIGRQSGRNTFIGFDAVNSEGIYAPAQLLAGSYRVNCELVYTAGDCALDSVRW